MSFDGSRSYDMDQDIVSYNWDLGNNDSTTGIFPEYIYSRVGNYTITLTVTDSRGNTDMDTTYALITRYTNRPPNKPFVKGASDGYEDIEYTYIAVATDPEGDAIKYVFDWGDNNLTVTDFYPSNTSVTAKHIWSFPGRYVVKIYIFDENYIPSNVTKHVVLIDARYCGYIGYLIDVDGDGMFDIFHTNVTKTETQIEFTSNGNYLIDSNGDDIEDYIYNPTTDMMSPIKDELKAQEGYVAWLFIVPFGIMVLVIVVRNILYQRKQHVQDLKSGRNKL